MMLSLLLWLLISPAAAASDAAPQPRSSLAERDRQPLAMPNHFGEPASECESVPQQVAGEDRAYPGTRLDRQPPGKLLHAVDRQVNGCREVTFVAEERQRALSRR